MVLVVPSEGTDAAVTLFGERLIQTDLSAACHCSASADLELLPFPAEALVWVVGRFHSAGSRFMGA